jgi:hypothetical protein
MTWTCYSVSRSLPSKVTWALSKIWVAANNMTFKPVAVRNLTEDFSLTTEEWVSACMYVKETVKIYTKNEHMMYNILENNLINVRLSYSYLDTNHEDEYGMVM